MRFVETSEVVGAILVPARDPRSPLQTARKGYVLANLAGLALNLQEVGGRGLEALGRFVGSASCYESAWTDTGDALARFADLMKGTA